MIDPAASALKDDSSQPANNRVRREASSILDESGGRRVLICSHSISCSPRDRRKGEAPPERRENPWVRWLIEAFHPICARVYNPDPPLGQVFIPAPTPFPPSLLRSFFFPPFFFSSGFWSRASLDQSYFRYFGCVRVVQYQTEKEHTLTHSPSSSS